MINIKVTARDLRLLKSLYKNSFMSFYQIKEAHFDKCKGSTIYNRLSKLIRGGLIESMRVNLVAIHRANKDVSAIYFVSKKGLMTLKSYLGAEINRETPVSINLSQLTHDLIVTDVIKRLEGLDNEVVNTKLLGASFNFNEQIPDAIVDSSSFKTAIEVELTAKSNFRYREIISNYRTSNKFSEVLYIVKDRPIEKKIVSIITGYNHSDESIDTGKFKFCTLEKFFNGEREFNKSVLKIENQSIERENYELL